MWHFSWFVVLCFCNLFIYLFFCFWYGLGFFIKKENDFAVSFFASVGGFGRKKCYFHQVISFSFFHFLFCVLLGFCLSVFVGSWFVRTWGLGAPALCNQFFPVLQLFEQCIFNHCPKLILGHAFICLSYCMNICLVSLIHWLHLLNRFDHGRAQRMWICGKTLNMYRR